MKYERMTERDEYGNVDIVDVDMVEMSGRLTFTDLFRVTKALSRLAELEDKIENGTLVEVPKGAVVLTPEERDEEMRLCNEELKQAVRECLRILRDISSPGIVEPFWVGWSEAINAAIREISEKYAVSVEVEE